jgi:serine/threonine-protein kinase
MSQLGRYEILRPLVRGGMAELLLARTTGMQAFERHVVIKRIRPELASDDKLVKMFLDEARLSASLHHQNIVQVYDVGEHDGAYFFAMEYVHGEDLRTIIHAVQDRHRTADPNATIPLDVVCQILVAAACGLHHAHEQLSSDRKPLGIVHRDISPGNILVGFDGSVKVVDFGLAKAALRSVQTRTGTLKGKAGYMSPEQCRGLMLDRRSDVFGLGIVLYELLTTRRLFKGQNEFQTMTAIVQSEVPPPSTLRAALPREIDEITLRALAKDPAARFRTADEMREALERFMEAHELRTSPKQLADYMKQLFGERPEPWLGDPPVARSQSVDDEISNEGLVEPPSQPNPKLMPRDPRSASPLAMAQAIATGEDTNLEFIEEGATVASDPPEFAGEEASASASYRGEDLAATVIAPPSASLVARLREGDDDTTTTRAGEDAIDVTPTPPPPEPPVPPPPARAETEDQSTNNLRLPAQRADNAVAAVTPAPAPLVEAAAPAPAESSMRSLTARAGRIATHPIGIAAIASVVLVTVAFAIATCGTHHAAAVPPDANRDAASAPDAAAEELPPVDAGSTAPAKPPKRPPRHGH